MTVPILDYRVVESEHRFTTVYDPVAKKSLSTIDGCVYSEARWDFGRGLALFFDLGVPFTNIVLIAYPDLRIIAKGSLNENSWKLQLLPSTRDGLAVDVVTEVPRTWGRDAAPGSGNTAPARSGLYHIRVPDNWRTAPGRRYTDCIREEHPSGLVELEVTELGTFDVAKYDALQYAAVEGDPIPENLIRPYAFRDGVMYWRKRHTGEVVMAAVDNLDAQTVIGGEGATWDGFRVNPARDEVVTWRENGELVFWKVQFPTAEPLCKARVITDETPHRLEAM
jgi:hypothetical protein